MAEARPARRPTTINGVPLDGSAPVPGGLILPIAAIGLPMLLGGAWIARDDLLFLLSADSAPARVERIVVIESRDRQPANRRYALDLVFTPPGGAPMRVVSPDARGERELCCEAGTIVTARFPRGAPEQARVVTFTQNFGLPAMLGGFGLFWTWLGALLLRARWRYKRRLARGEIVPPAPEAEAAATVTAHLDGLRREETASGPRWIVQARGILPATGEVRMFEGAPLPFDPTPQMAHMLTVQVRIGPAAAEEGPAMDLSFLRAPRA